MLGGLMNRTRSLITEGVHGVFEQLLSQLFAERLRRDKAFGVELWSALTNLSWSHPTHGQVGYSFRAAGDLVAALLGSGHYLDWYCSGEPAVVSEEIAQAMKIYGWEVILD